MDKVLIDGIARYDGEYDVDFSQEFTNGELHSIKKHTGITAGQISEAFKTKDNDLLVALAIVALERNGLAPVDVDALWEGPVGAIVLQIEDRPKEEPDPTKPQPPADTGNEPKPETDERSGSSSSTTGDRRENDPSPTGPPLSDTSAISDPATSPA